MCERLRQRWYGLIMIIQRVGLLMEGDEFTPDNGKTWLTVKDTCLMYPPSKTGKVILLVTSISGKRWWGFITEEVIVK